MARKVLCECCGKMVTPAVARKHREEIAWAEHLESLGQPSVYTGNPTPPITTESVFGHASPPPPTVADNGMDVDDTTTMPVGPLPSPPITNPDEYLPEHYHSIPDNDFQPDTNLDDPLYPPELYNEDLETAAVEEELCAFSKIRYGTLTPPKPTCIEWLIVPNRGEHQRLRHCNLQGI